MTAVIYCRVSSKEQIEGTSLEVQEAACRDYARANDIRVLRVFVEQGESAKFADRTQLLELIDFCRTNKGAVQALLVWKVDRFSRNVADHFSIKATLGKYGIRIVSVTEPIDAKPEGKLMETILAGFAQFDNDIRAMRTIQGMRRKIQDGIFPWGPPFGYKSTVVSGEKKNQPDAPDQPSFGLLQRAWRDYAGGAFTQAEMGRRMRSWGLSSPRALAFSPQSLSTLFTNRYYAGILVDPWSGEEHEGKHIPMVTRQEFARVQQIIAGRTRSVTHQKERPEFPLRGIVRCNSCRRYMMGSSSRGRTRSYPYYWCRLKTCANRGKSYPASEIHDEFEGFLDYVTPTEQVLRDLGAQLIHAIKRRSSEQDGLIARSRQRVIHLNRQLDELIRMRMQSLLTDREFMHQKNIILSQRDAIESKGAQIPDLDSLATQLGAIVGPLTHLSETRKAIRPEFRRRFDRFVLPAGIVHRESRTAELGLLFSTIGTSAHLDSPRVALSPAKLNQIISEIQELWSILRAADETKPDPEKAVRQFSPN